MKIVIEIPDAAAEAFEARAKSLNSQTTKVPFVDGVELIKEFITGHLVTAAQEAHQKIANKAFDKEARRVQRLMNPDEED